MSARRTRSARVRLVAGSACVLVAAVPAVHALAAEEPGSQLQSFSMSADAPALRVRQGTQQTEAVVPQTLAQLRNGPVGFAQSSVAWPGTIAGNVGSLLVLAADAPKEATVLDTPVRAEARTGSGPSEVTNDSVPGTSMTAGARESVVAADTMVSQAAALPAGTVGATRSSSRAALTGARTALAEASSAVQDVSLLDGQVTVAAVTSTARATTDGARTEVEGRTVVTDLRVAGQPVSVGSDGIVVAGQAGPATAPAVAAVNEVVENANLVIALGQPVGAQEAGEASYTSGSLVIAFTQSSGAVLSVVLGGANVAVDAVPGTPSGAKPPAPVPPAPDVPAADGGPEQVRFDIGTGGEAAALPGAPTVAGGVGPPGSPPGPAPVAAVDLGGTERSSFPLAEGVSAGWLLLAVLGSLLIGSALRRVPDRVLPAAALSTTCPLAET